MPALYGISRFGQLQDGPLRSRAALEHRVHERVHAVIVLRVREGEQFLDEFGYPRAVRIEYHVASFEVRLVFHEASHLVGVRSYFLYRHSLFPRELREYGLERHGLEVDDVCSSLAVQLEHEIDSLRVVLLVSFQGVAGADVLRISHVRCHDDSEIVGKRFF